MCRKAVNQSINQKNYTYEYFGELFYDGKTGELFVI